MKEFNLILLLFTVLLFPSCKKGSVLCDNEIKVLNLELLEQNIRDEVEANNPMGYAYVIAKDGKVVTQGGYGLARSQAEGNIPMTTSTLMHIASVSKTITTAAVLRLIEEKGLTLEDYVYSYLPPRWRISEWTKAITFRHLLRHEVRFPIKEKGSVSYDSLRAYAERGLSISLPKYSNINHSFFRVIIPRLWDKYRPLDGDYSDEFTASVYNKYIREEIFHPQGIIGTLNTIGLTPALAYENSGDNKGRFGSKDYTNASGAYGWQMSAYELAEFWAYLWFSEKIISKKMQKTMKSGPYGLWESIMSHQGELLYGKTGYWFFKEANGQRNCYRTHVILYPRGAQATLLINSCTSKSPAKILRDAYDNALEDGC